MSTHAYGRAVKMAHAVALLLCLPGCTAMGSLLSPYPEKFSCKNNDHGQCIHPQRAYEDAVAGVHSRSDPGVTNDRRLLRDSTSAHIGGRQKRQGPHSAYGSYKDSVYQELKGLIEAPVTPMLKPARTIRTLILPYADRQRPDRLYMPRYVYSIVDKPVWVVGGALVAPPGRAERAPLLGQVHDTAAASDDAPDAASAAPLPAPRDPEARP